MHTEKKIPQLLLNHRKRLFSFFLIILMLGGVLDTVNVFAMNEPEVRVYLNGAEISQVDYDDSIMVKNGDTFTFELAFGEMAAGDRYTCIMPSFFINLNEEQIALQNRAVLDSGLIRFERTTIGNGQQLDIIFEEAVSAAQFSFSCTLKISSGTSEEEQQIIFGGDYVITIVKQSSGGGGTGEYVGPNSPAQPFTGQDKDFRKEGNSSISEIQFMEDQDRNYAYYYTLRVNTEQVKKRITGTLSDTLPSGMNLFIPAAPNCGYDSYGDAYLSFSISTYYPIVEYDDEIGYYLDVATHKSSSMNTYVTQINRVEQAQGRQTVVSKEMFDWRIRLPESLTDTGIINADNTAATFSSQSVGYKINPDGTVTLSFLTKGEENTQFVKELAGDWQQDSLYVPIYTTTDGAVGPMRSEALYTQAEIQSLSGNCYQNFQREYVGSQNEGGGVTSYTWEYKQKYKDPNDDSDKLTNEFSLIVYHNAATGENRFAVEFDVDENSYLYGKCFTIRPRIYFDKTKLSIPEDGKIRFTNEAHFDALIGKVTTTYTFNFNTNSAFVSNLKKEVNGTNKIYMNPKGTDTTHTYTLYFKKTGSNELNAKLLKAYDRLDPHLEFVKGSIKIYAKEGADWEEITDSGSIHDSYSEAAGNNANLRVSCAAGLSGDQIEVTNYDKMGGQGEYKIEFSARLKSDVQPGTIVKNTFGDTVTLYTDYQLSLHKRDERGALITTDAAVFKVEYTTEEDYEAAELGRLSAPDGTEITTVSTAPTGMVNLSFRTEAETFYVKLTETKAPDGYTPLSEPIWIKVDHNALREAGYTLLHDAGGAVELSTTDGVRLDIENPDTILPKSHFLRVLKIDADTNRALPGASFTLKKGDEVIGTANTVTDSEGRILFALPEDCAGDYTLTEINAPDGYIIDVDTVSFTVDADGKVTIDPLPDGVTLATENEIALITIPNTKMEEKTFIKEPSRSTAAIGSLVDYKLTGFHNANPGPVTEYTVIDYVPAELDFVSAQFPAFRRGKGVTYNVLYRSNTKGVVTLYQNVDAGTAFTANAPVLDSGEKITRFYIESKEVPSGFGYADTIVFSFRVRNAPVSGRSIVNRATVDFVYDSEEQEHDYSANPVEVTKVSETSESSTASYALATGSNGKTAVPVTGDRVTLAIAALFLLSAASVILLRVYGRRRKRR